MCPRLMKIQVSYESPYIPNANHPIFTDDPSPKMKSYRKLGVSKYDLWESNITSIKLIIHRLNLIIKKFQHGYPICPPRI